MKRDRVADRHAYIHTYNGHCDSMIESAQWADSMKMFVLFFFSICARFHMISKCKAPKFVIKLIYLEISIYSETQEIYQF